MHVCVHFSTSTTQYLPLFYLTMQCTSQTAGALHYTEGRYTARGDLCLKTSTILTYHPQLQAHTHTLCTHKHTLLTNLSPSSFSFSNKPQWYYLNWSLSEFSSSTWPAASLPLFISQKLVWEPCSGSSMLAVKLWDCCWLCSRFKPELKRHPKEKMLIKQKQTQGPHMERHCCFIFD